MWGVPNTIIDWQLCTDNGWREEKKSNNAVRAISILTPIQHQMLAFECAFHCFPADVYIRIQMHSFHSVINIFFSRFITATYSKNTHHALKRFISYSIQTASDRPIQTHVRVHLFGSNFSLPLLRVFIMFRYCMRFSFYNVELSFGTVTVKQSGIKPFHFVAQIHTKNCIACAIIRIIVWMYAGDA